MTRSEDVRAALTKKYRAPEYGLFFEVGDATGGRARRWADAIAMGLWPSRGLALQGFEIKVSRSDWLSELKKPAKAEAIACYCRNWWIVTPPGVVKDGELPETWGHQEVRAGGGLHVVKVAPANEHQRSISPEFLAALLRRADQRDRTLDYAARQEAIGDEKRRMEAAFAARLESHVRTLQSGKAAAEASLQAIYDACGLSPEEVRTLFYSRDFANAVAAVHRLGVARTHRGVADLARTIRPMADAIDTFLNALPKDAAA